MPHAILDSCNGCSACARQCPVQAIHGVFDELFTIEATVCIDCRVCGIVCPVEAVADEHGRIAQRIPREERPRPLFELTLCNGCGTCIDWCPFDCLTLVGRTHLGAAYLSAPERCVSCGDCVVSCHKGAITMGIVDLETYEPRIQASKLIDELRCSPSPAPPQEAA